MRQPPSLIAIAHRSASGSLAITKSAFSRLAYSIAKSIAPASSGFGKGVVGKSGFGCSCSETIIGLAKPALLKIFKNTSAPTPCSGV